MGKPPPFPHPPSLAACAFFAGLENPPPGRSIFFNDVEFLCNLKLRVPLPRDCALDALARDRPGSEAFILFLHRAYMAKRKEELEDSEQFSGSLFSGQSQLLLSNIRIAL